MALINAALGAGARLSNYMSANLLARAYPAAMIGEILDGHGYNSKRIRSLPRRALHLILHGLKPVPGSGLRTGLCGRLSRAVMEQG